MSKSDCKCQGNVEENPGNTYSFGCSYQPYNRGCKFKRSTAPLVDKYKAVEAQSREDVKGILDDLADIGSSYLKHYVPGPYREMTKHSKRAISCRIGNHDSERLQPFSGATVNLDFCAHNHKDFNNKDKGAIAVS